MELPVADSFQLDEEKDRYVGVMTLFVSPGVSWMVDDEGLPWNFDRPEFDEVQALLGGIQFADRQRRVAAALAEENAGVYQGVDNERVLSVRLNDVCDHECACW